MERSSSSSKRLQSTSRDDDRLSSLSDDLLLHILSFLDTKSAVLTGIYSSRWRDLWTSVPILYFDKYLFDGDDDTEDGFHSFTSFVERSLLLYACPKIQKFCLCSEYGCIYDDYVDAWVRYAVRRDVQELDLSFNGETLFSREFYLLPSWLYKCENLISLKLMGCKIDAFDNIFFSKLRVLELLVLELTDYSLNMILDGSPVLENLTLQGCLIHDCICISSTSIPQLKHLTIHDCIAQGFEIQAPNLQTLCAVGVGLSEYPLSLKDMLSIREADISVHFDWRNNSNSMIYQTLALLLKELRHAKALKLCRTCVQVMSSPALSELNLHVSNTECLTLKIGLQKFELPGIINLLWSLHAVERLIIKFVSSQLFPESQGEHDFDEKRYWASLPSSFPCMEHHLKRIEIFGIMGREFGSYRYNVKRFDEQKDNIIKLARFLLRNAVILEEMNIHVSKPDFVEMEEWLKMILMLGENLSALPRASPGASIVFI